MIQTSTQKKRPAKLKMITACAAAPARAARVWNAYSRRQQIKTDSAASADHVLAKVRSKNIVALCRTVLVLWSFVPSHSATGQAAPPLFEQIAGQEFTHNVRQGESLASIGARFGVGADWLAANNNLSAKSPEIGRPLAIDNRHIVVNGIRDGITINIPQRMLFYFRSGRLIQHFPVGLGRPDRPTPTGPFNIVAKIENPTWYVPPSIQEEMRREGRVVKTCVPSGPDNPLGSHWLGLSIPRFGIHGTNDPTSVYHFDLYGCIVGNNEDVAQLFADVAVGTSGVLVYRRLLMAKVGDQIFLENHPDIYKRQPSVQRQFETTIQFFKLESLIDRDRAQETIRKQEGIARNITRTNRSRNSR